MTTCDYHDLPVVCGECGRGRKKIGRVWYHDFSQDGDIGQQLMGAIRQDHPFRPVHRITKSIPYISDSGRPEVVEGTAVVPCGEAT